MSSTFTKEALPVETVSGTASPLAKAPQEALIIRMAEAENHTAPKVRHTLAWVMAVILLLPVLYVLSAAPVCWVHEHTQGKVFSYQFVHTFYAPLIWVYHHPSKVSDFMHWYTHFWHIR